MSNCISPSDDVFDVPHLRIILVIKYAPLTLVSGTNHILMDAPLLWIRGDNTHGAMILFFMSLCRMVLPILQALC